VHASALVPVTAGSGRATFRVEEGWGPGAYVVAFHHRPLDAAQSRMPGRAVGLAWFGVGRASRTLGVKLEPPAQIRPRTTLSIPVSIAGLAAGEEARVIVAAVDVGILNLTNYKPPAPEDYFLGQRRLSGEVRDLYGALIDGMQGTRGRLRSGGDGGGMSMSGNPPSQPPLALYSGIVTVDAQGKATVNFDIPPFDGTARVMAVAWSGTKLGHAATDVLIRDPVVLTTTLPRFLAAGDRSTLRVDIDNVEGPAGEYVLSLVGDGAVDLQGAAQRVTLAAKARHGLTVPVTGKGTGRAEVTVRIAGPNDLSVERTYVLNTRPAYPPIERRTVSTLAKGQSLVVGPEVLADVVAGTGAVSLAVTPPLSIDVPALLLALDRYPYGCSEQITSRALPMLYLSELAPESSLGLDASGEQRIRDAIQRVLARQSSEGAIGLWSAGGTDNWLHAYVTDFLTRAKERGFQVPDAAFRLALDRLRNSVNISERELNDGGATAYALYVLTRNSVAPLGDLRYLADARLDALDTPLAKGHVAAALALLGDRTRAERVFNAALEAIPVQASAPEPGHSDYGSMLRDAAALATLASEAGMDRIARAAIVRADAARAVTPRLSTQEQTWLVLAARALMKEGEKLSLEVDGQPHRGTFFRTLKSADLAGKQIRIVNNGDEPVRVVVAIQGSPAAPEPAAAKGFTVNRSYFTLDGKPANPTTVAQNQRLVVVLKVAETEKVRARVVLADYLPAGFEIDNPRLVASGETGGLAWLGDTTETAYSEFRDNRFVAAFDRDDDSKDGIVVAYTVRAVSPGRYAHPPAIVEDMYRPDRFARTSTGTVEVTAR
jgi:alpha-2-macroglobulin